MSDLDTIRAKNIELEVAVREAVDLIAWFEGWLNNRDEPIRYDPIDLAQYPTVYSVNYDNDRVDEIKKFLRSVLGEE